MAARLQELYAQALARRDAGSTQDCVSPEDILALVRRDLGEERRLEILDHVMACNACRREFDLLRAIETAGAASAATPSSRSLRRRLAPVALAASLLLAVGVGVLVRNRGPSGDIPRGGNSSLVLLAPGAEASSAEPIRFVWSSIPGARQYRLEVLDAAESVIVAEQTADTTLLLPGGRLGMGDYRWWVRDATPGAQGASALRNLRIRSQ